MRHWPTFVTPKNKFLKDSVLWHIHCGKGRPMNKTFSWLVTLLLLAMSTLAEGQQRGKVPLIGVLSPGSAGVRDSYFHFVEAFRQGLRDLGYAEGKNIVFEYRYAEGKLDRMPSLVT